MRGPTLLKGHNYFDCRITCSSLKDDINIVVKTLIELNIIDKEQDYAYGLDKQDDVISYDHYHVRGKTKYLTSYIKKIFKENEILSNIPKGQQHMMVKSCMPDDDRGDYLSYLGYCGKDHLIFSTCQLDIKTAKEKYNIKKKRLREKKEVNTEKQELNDFLLSRLKYQYGNELEGIKTTCIEDLLPKVQELIVEYAIEHEKAYYLSRTNLLSRSIIFLGKYCNVSYINLVRIINGEIKI